MPQVQSRVNGLIVNIPADARNVVGRFATKGGNELIFENLPKSRRRAVDQEEAMVVESLTSEPKAGKKRKAKKSTEELA
jgi:hypothetical protein